MEALDIDFLTKPWNTFLAYIFDAHHTQKAKPKITAPLGILEMPEADEDGYFIPSSSLDGGFITAKLNPYSEEFVKHAVLCNGHVLNIGCGYGIPERLALFLGAHDLICNDVCAKHLTIIKSLVPEYYNSKLKVITGYFPDEVNLTDGSINVIGIFRLLHFFEPEQIILTIRKAYNLLMPGGILILSAETPYLGNWQKFIPEYERRVEQKKLWPGYISDTLTYETGGYSQRLPPKMNFLDVDTLTRVLTENGFSMLKCSTFDRTYTFPASILLEGRESIGAIAQKTC